MVTSPVEFSATDLCALWMHEDVLSEMWHDGMPDQRELFARAHRHQQDFTSSLILVFRDDNDAPVGWITLRKMSSICADFHGGWLKGYRGKRAREYGIRTISFCFEQWNCLKLISTVPSYNKGANMALGSLGFSREGYSADAVQRGGQFYGLTYWGLSYAGWGLLARQ